MNWIKNIFVKLHKTSILEKKQKDFGILVLVFLVLLVGYRFFKNGLIISTEFYTLVTLFVLVLIITFVYKKIFVPFLFVWLLIGEFLGAITSNLVMAIVYFLIFSPIVLILRLFRKENVYKPEWKTASKVINYTKLS